MILDYHMARQESIKVQKQSQNSKLNKSHFKEIKSFDNINISNHKTQYKHHLLDKCKLDSEKKMKHLKEILIGQAKYYDEVVLQPRTQIDKFESTLNTLNQVEKQSSYVNHSKWSSRDLKLAYKQTMLKTGNQGLHSVSARDGIPIDSTSISNWYCRGYEGQQRMLRDESTGNYRIVKNQEIGSSNGG